MMIQNNKNKSLLAFFILTFSFFVFAAFGFTEKAHAFYVIFDAEGNLIISSADGGIGADTQRVTIPGRLLPRENYGYCVTTFCVSDYLAIPYVYNRDTNTNIDLTTQRSNTPIPPASERANYLQRAKAALDRAKVAVDKAKTKLNDWSRTGARQCQTMGNYINDIRSNLQTGGNEISNMMNALNQTYQWTRGYIAADPFAKLFYPDPDAGRYLDLATQTEKNYWDTMIAAERIVDLCEGL